MYHIFERLNTGGTLLANQEIRNCVYHGSFVRFLEDMNGSETWRRILGNREPDRRRKDMELLVRFFAMRDLTGYAKPMKDLLSRFMRKNGCRSQTVLEGVGIALRRLSRCSLHVDPENRPGVGTLRGARDHGCRRRCPDAVDAVATGSHVRRVRKEDPAIGGRQVRVDCR